jgi:hypothetical protein
MQKQIWLCTLLIGVLGCAAVHADQAPPTSPPVVELPAGTPAPAAPADPDAPAAELPAGQPAPPPPKAADEANADTASPGAASANVQVSDAQLKREVEQALRAHYGLGKAGIRVSVIQGVVTLRGTVASSVQIDQAKDVVSRVPGVQEINNELHAKGG